MKILRKIQQKLTQKSKENAKNISFLSNLIIGFLIISVAFACLYPIRADVEVSSIENRIYRKGNLTDGVSLLFNVYSDTDAVYSILETLEKHSAKATFFVGGCWADDNVDCLNAIKSKGHEIGNHGYFHKDHPSLTKQENLKEISLCNEFVKKATGVEISLFAPPSGSYDEKTIEVTESLGLKTILWTRDTIDWRDKNSALVYTRATKNISGGEFVLMHPTKHTSDALNDILNYYETCSLRVVTVSENLQVGG